MSVEMRRDFPGRPSGQEMKSVAISWVASGRKLAKAKDREFPGDFLTDNKYNAVRIGSTAKV